MYSPCCHPALHQHLLSSQPLKVSCLSSCSSKLHLCRDLYTSAACFGAQPSIPWLLTALGQLSVTLCPSPWPGDTPPCLRFIHIPSCFSGRVKSLPVWKPCTFCSLCCLLSSSVVSNSDLMDCSNTGSPVLHYLPEFAQTHVHRVGDAIQPSHPLLSPSPPTFSLSQHQGLFQ